MTSSLAISQELDKASDLSWAADFPSIGFWKSEGYPVLYPRLIEIPSFTDEIRKLEQKILKATQHLEETLTALEVCPPIEVEQDI